MNNSRIAFLGPEGTFTHLVARKRFGNRAALRPLRSVKEVFESLADNEAEAGLVPVENSSGGTIYETVDRLVDERYPFFIREALSLNVRLALLGRDKKNVRVIYSHFAPMHHCEQWLNEHFPEAERREIESTSLAAQRAAQEAGAAAIANREAAKLYGLEVLEFPIKQDFPNVTQFLLLGRERESLPQSSKTSLVVHLPNSPGSLCDLLLPLKAAGINLTRILSRPVVGHPNTYLFFIDLQGSEADPAVRNVVKEIRNASASCRFLGSYPVRPAYNS